MYSRKFLRFSSLAGLCVMVALVAACNFSTANISSFKVGKDAEVTTEASTFAPADKICAVCAVSNVPGKVTLKIETYAEKVEGVDPNLHVEAFDKSYDLESDSTAKYQLSPSPEGWHAGTYRLEAKLFIDGQEKSKKTATVTVAAPSAS